MSAILDTITAYRELRSTVKVAERLGIHHSTVNDRLKAAGEPMRRKGEHGRFEHAGPRGRDADRVVVAYRRLGNVREAAELVGVPPSTAHGWLKARGVDTSDKFRHRLTRSQVAALCVAYQDGSSTRELADQYGVNKKTIASVLRGEGVPLRPAHGVASGAKASNALADRLSPSKIRSVVVRYERGASTRELAADLECGPSAVAELLRSRGVELRVKGPTMERAA